MRDGTVDIEMGDYHCERQVFALTPCGGLNHSHSLPFEKHLFA